MGKLVLEEVECPICGEADKISVFSAKPMDNITEQKFNVSMCKKCGLLITNPRPSQSSMNEFYESGFYEKNEKSTKKVFINPVMLLFQRLRYRLVSKNKKSGSILDIGCGKGKFLKTATQNGWDAWGVEPSRRSASFMENDEELNIFGGKIENAKLPDRYFDVATMWHTLEHFYDPVNILVNIRQKLKKDGILIVRVPNCNSWDYFFGKDKWFHLDVPRHLYHFSPQSLTKILEKSGFSVIGESTSSLEDNPLGTLQTLMSKMGFSTGAIFKVIKSQSQKKKQYKVILQSGVTIFAAFLLITPSFLISELAQLTGHGGTVTVIAVKKVAKESNG